MSSEKILVFNDNNKKFEQISFQTIPNVKEMNISDASSENIEKPTANVKEMNISDANSEIIEKPTAGKKTSNQAFKTVQKKSHKLEKSTTISIKHLQKIENLEKNASMKKFKKKNSGLNLIEDFSSFAAIISDTHQIKILKKTFEEAERNKEADSAFNGFENNLKGLLDNILVENSIKNQILEKKQKKIKKIINEFFENSDYSIKTEILTNSPFRLYEELKEKLNEMKVSIFNERKVQKTLNFMKEKRKKTLIYFKNQCFQLEKYNEIFDSEKKIIEKKTNVLKTDEILSKITVSEFKKDLFANRKFNKEVIDRKKLIEKSDLDSLQEEMNVYLKENDQVKIFKEKLIKKKKIIKELDQKAYFLKNLQIHVKKDSLDYLDRISDIFIYNKPEDFILEKYSDLNIPLTKKKNSETFAQLYKRMNLTKKIQEGFFKQKSTKIKLPAFLTSNYKINLSKGSNAIIPSMSLIKTPSMNSVILKNEEENKKNKEEELKKIKEKEKESLITRINAFYSKHNNNINQFAKFIIQEHTKLAFQEESLNNIICDLTEQLRKVKKNYTKMIETLNDLIKQEENTDLDVGIIKAFSYLRGSTEENTLLIDNSSTICSLKLEINGLEIDKTVEFLNSQKCQSFVFQAYFFFQENLLRLLSICFTICQNFDFNHLNQKLSHLIKGIFERLNENYEDIDRNKIYAKIKEMSQNNLKEEPSEYLSEISENPEKNEDCKEKSEKKQPFEIHAKLKEMQKKFFGHFPQFKLGFKEFLQLMKSDIVLYNFFSEKKFEELLESLQEKFILAVKHSKLLSQENLFMNIFYEEIQKFKQISHNSFQKDLEKTLKIYEKLFVELNEDKISIKKKCDSLRQIKDEQRSPLILVNKIMTLERIEKKNQFKTEKIQKCPKKTTGIRPILKEKNSLKIKELTQYQQEEMSEQEYLKKNIRETKVIFKYFYFLFMKINYNG